MVIYISTVMIHFMIFKIVSTNIPEIVTFSVELSQDENIEVNLIPIESFLVNENVPVWLTSDHSPVELIPIDGAMNHLGPLTIYRDPNTCATAVYFHRQETFSGIVGHHHVIENLRYNSRTSSVIVNDDTVFPSPIKKHHERLPDNEIIHQIEDDKTFTWHNSLLPFPHTVYIETLVIVNHDVMEQLNDHIEIISFVAKFLNNVDMMFSEIKKPNIKFNIAGIIIGSDWESFPKVISYSCYEEDSDGEYELDVYCLLDSLRDTLHEYHTISSRSYDIAIFITGYRLFQVMRKTSATGRIQTIRKVIEGMAEMPNPNYRYGLGKEDIILGVASFYSAEAFLPVAAHEIAHMFGATHEGGPLFGTDRLCAAHLMKHNDHYCKRCFRFGGKTPQEFVQFFGSRQACIFRNKPRSLHSAHPLVFWNEEEQCKCYGFPTALLNSPSHTPSHEVDCKSQLQCIAEDHKSHPTGIFMDGTPCDSQRIGTKVCWDGECLPVLQDTELGFEDLQI